MDAMSAVEKTIAAVDEAINSKYIYALKQVQLERIRLEVEMNKKINDLELEYHSKLAEFDNKRKQIINGDYTPTEQEFKYEFMKEDEKPIETAHKGIPKFWQTIFHNLDVLSDMVQTKDDEVLNHLIDVRLVLISEPRGYRIEFEFSENEYMTNKVLSKEYYYADSFDPTEPLQYEGLYISYSKGTKIEWKSPDKDPTQTKISKKLKHKSSNQVKTVEKVEKIDSFFNFFDPIETKIEEADEETKDLMLADFDIAETLRHNVIPRAVIYFTGEGIEVDDEFDEEMDDLEDYDDDDDDDEDDEEDDEVTAEEDGKKVRKLKANGRGGNTEVPSECKQQ